MQNTLGAFSAGRHLVFRLWQSGVVVSDGLDNIHNDLPFRIETRGLPPCVVTDFFLRQKNRSMSDRAARVVSGCGGEGGFGRCSCRDGRLAGRRLLLFSRISARKRVVEVADGRRCRAFYRHFLQPQHAIVPSYPDPATLSAIPLVEDTRGPTSAIDDAGVLASNPGRTVCLIDDAQRYRMFQMTKVLRPPLDEGWQLFHIGPGDRLENNEQLHSARTTRSNRVFATCMALGRRAKVGKSLLLITCLSRVATLHLSSSSDRSAKPSTLRCLIPHTASVPRQSKSWCATEAISQCPMHHVMSHQCTSRSIPPANQSLCAPSKCKNHRKKRKRRKYVALNDS